MLLAWWARRMFRRFGYDIVRFHSGQLIMLLSKYHVDCVIDVGANEGQFAARIIAEGWNGPIVSFEPLPAAHEQLTRKASAYKNWIVAPRMALGDEPGDAIMNVSKNNQASSLLAAGELLRKSPELTYVTAEQVVVARLDHVAAKMLDDARRVFVKVDTQGYEAHVIRGASGLVDRIIGFRLEMSFEPLYLGESDMTTVVSLMANLGFDLWDLLPSYRNPSGRLLQVDGIFLRRDMELK
jgi:FkbM family methyltransferase